MDHNVARAITEGVRSHGVDVVTAETDSATRLSDPDLLERATELGRVLFSRDADLCREACRRQSEGIFFAGVIYAHQLRVPIGKCIHELVLVAQAMEHDEMQRALCYLPL